MIKKKTKTAKKRLPHKQLAKVPLKFWDLVKQTTNIIVDNYRLIGSISIIFGLLYFLFSNGISVLDISELRGQLEETSGVGAETVGGRFLLAALVFQTASSLDQVGAVFMLFVALFSALALLWVLRHIWANKVTTVREAYYKGMYPIIPFSLLFGLGVLQLLPFALGSSLLDTALKNNILNGGLEITLAVLVLMVLPLIWSIKMITRTTLAMVIVTIPDMWPMEAYASAKKLIKGRQIYVIRKLLSLVIAILAVLAVMLLVFIAVVPSLSVILSVLINIIVMPVAVTYLYAIYRGLL